MDGDYRASCEKWSLQTKLEISQGLVKNNLLQLKSCMGMVRVSPEKKTPGYGFGHCDHGWKWLNFP